MFDKNDVSVQATPTPAIKANVPGMEKYAGIKNGEEMKVLMFFEKPSMDLLLRKLGFEMIDVNKQASGEKRIEVRMTDKDPGVEGLNKNWSFTLDDYFLLGNTKKAIMENLDGRVKLKEALKNDKVGGLLKLYHINPDNITLIYFGANVRGRAASLMDKLTSGGGSVSGENIYLNVNLTSDKMIEQLEIEIPKLSRNLEKADQARQAKIKHDLKY